MYSGMSLWNTLDVPLPDLLYSEDVSSKGKGSTTWASHSHSPTSVVKWDDFHDVISAASLRPENQEEVSNFQLVGPSRSVRIEEDVTACTLEVLASFGRSAGLLFESDASYILSIPDILVSRRGTSEARVHTFRQLPPSPIYGSKASQQRENQANWVSNFLFPLETKPAWKFRFLLGEDSTDMLIHLWEMPDDFNGDDLVRQRALPDRWGHDKKKVFHLVRQVYGQMVASKRRYGAFHFYERWWFCCRTASGILRVSEAIDREDTTPSVLQVIKAICSQPDHVLEESGHHLLSPLKNPTTGGKRDEDDNDDDEVDDGSPTPKGKKPKRRNFLRAYMPGSRGKGKWTKKERRVTAVMAEKLASRIQMGDCDIVDFTDNVQLLTYRKDPSVLIKLQRDPRKTHVANEMRHEALVYERLSRMEGSHCDVVPSFHGFSSHPAVALLCLSREGPDFEDLGCENISRELKKSAVESLQVLSNAGLLHGDIALRNVVQSRENPNRAKIIDFGRAEFTSDRLALREQVDVLELLLEIER